MFRLRETLLMCNLIVVLVCKLLGICYVNLDRLSDAEKAYAESLRICKALYPLGHSALTEGKIWCTFN